MDTVAFLDHLRALPAYRDQIAHIERLPPRKPHYGELERPLHPALHDRLRALGLLPLYHHQAQAVDASRRGENTFIVTPAASGKTLCYNVPVLERLLTEARGRALYIFPTKALAQDQLRGLGELAAPFKLAMATFDGDTPVEERGEIRRGAQLVLTNPDMLHLGILPNHRSWAHLFRRLSYVVIDEAHVYRGVFGSHMAQVLRRLRRICALYGSRPQLICASATIANPREHIERLTGLPFTVVDEDGSPYGGKDFCFWNPPLIDLARSQRRSANTEASLLFTELVSHGLRTITFALSRKLAELIYIYTREQLCAEHPGLAEKVKPYRAGYLPQERRLIERQLFDGELLGVAATSALELGIDIGTLDATVLNGYPGSIASTWQQAGRSGRRGERSLSFLIGLDNPLDQYFMRHPEAFFGHSVENALTNPDNPYVLGPHLLCAAWERPLDEVDGELFGPGFAPARDELVQQGLLRPRHGRWYPSPAIPYPAEGVGLRSASAQRYTVVDTARGGRELDTVEEAVAFFQVHPGAIYLHQGDAYVITGLDLPSRTAYAQPADVPYYTQARDITDIAIIATSRHREVGQSTVCLGTVQVTTRVTGFRRKRHLTEETISEEPLDLPPQTFTTVGLWFDCPEQAHLQLSASGLDLAGGLHATEHAAIAMLPLFALCDRSDIGGMSTPLHPESGRAQIFIYDAHPGGIGIAEKGYQLIEELWQATLKAISECPCQEGCPSCVQSPKCGSNNEPLDKGAAIVILRHLLGRGGPA